MSGPIASIFWHNEDLSEDILLDGVVCVVDGVFGLNVGDGDTRTDISHRESVEADTATLVQQIEKDKASGEVKESLR